MSNLILVCLIDKVIFKNRGVQIISLNLLILWELLINLVLIILSLIGNHLRLLINIFIIFHSIKQFK